ncbi:MAG: hypothetical protein H6710_00040 [Myxococcales bacterium]|nr:hypothetical protein [Myxococcales bacterium]
MAKRFSKKRCIQGCRKLANAHDRARCCADCMALHLAQMKDDQRVVVKSARGQRRPPTMWSRRHALLFAETVPAAARPNKPGKPRTVAARSASGLAGVLPLRDAASDRQDARAVASGIASSGVLICQALYPENGPSETATQRRQAREQCVAAIQALQVSANGIIDAATSGAGSDAAEIEAALEEMRQHVEDVQNQAEAQDQAKAAARAEEERQQQEAEARNRNLLIGVGVVGLIAAAGVGYVVLRDEDDDPRKRRRRSEEAP